MKIHIRVIARLLIVVIILIAISQTKPTNTPQSGALWGVFTTLLVLPFVYEAWTLLVQVFHRDKSSYELGKFTKQEFRMLLVGDWSDRKAKKRKRTK